MSKPSNKGQRSSKETAKKRADKQSEYTINRGFALTELAIATRIYINALRGN